MVESLQIQLKKGVPGDVRAGAASHGDNYAYDIAVAPHGRGGGHGRRHHPPPLMRRMQNDGLVSTSSRRSARAAAAVRKYYALTKSGAQALKSQIPDWQAFGAAVRKIREVVT